MAPSPARPQSTRDAIFAFYESRQDSGYREHLGASLIGTACERALWFSFRWATRAHHSGRLLRLFDRGQMEETRFASALRSIGVKVMTVDPDTGAQWVCRARSGHFGGSADAVIYGAPEAPEEWAICEMKTHSAKSFADLVKKGVTEAKPLHHAQMTVYGHLLGIDQALYLAVNKNDDDLYAEWIKIDPAEGDRLVAKAERIVSSPTPLSKISRDPSWFVCRFCDHKDVCHGGALPERHCRSCMNSTPVADGKWHCARYDMPLTLAEQKAGCADHRYLPPLVAGEQTDGAEDGAWISYTRADGTVWVDDGPKT
jgi:hypothetical protein